MNKFDRYEYNERNYVREVSLKALVRYGLQSWKTMLCCGLIFAVLLGGFSVYRNHGRKAEMEEAYANYQINLDAYNASIKELRSEIKTIQDQITNESDYLETSVYNNINPYHEQMASAELAITMTDKELADDSAGGDNADAYKVTRANSLVRSYGVYILDIMDLDTVAAQTGMDRRAVRELIGVNYAENTNLILLTVRHEKSEVAEQIRDYILATIKEKKDIFTGEYGEHTVTVLDKTTHENLDKTLITYQAERINNISTMTKSLTAVQQSITEMQKPVPVTKYSKKWLLKTGIIMSILGFAGGCFLALLFLIVRMLSTGILVAGSEISRRFKIKCLADRTEDGGSEQEFLDRILAKAEIYGDRESASKFLIVSSQGKKELFSLQKGLEKQAAGMKEKLSFDIAPMTDTSAESMRKLASADAVILAETVGASRYQKIVNVSETVGEAGREIIGTVIL